MLLSITTSIVVSSVLGPHKYVDIPTTIKFDNRFLELFERPFVHFEQVLLHLAQVILLSEVCEGRHVGIHVVIVSSTT